jgi:hypothetical protein
LVGAGYAGGVANLLCARATNTEDRGQSDFGVLVVRNVYPAIRAISSFTPKKRNLKFYQKPQANVNLDAACDADPRK